MWLILCSNYENDVFVNVRNIAVTNEQCQAAARHGKWQSVYWIMLLWDILYTVSFSSNGLAHICWVGSNKNCILLLNTAIFTWQKITVLRLAYYFYKFTTELKKKVRSSVWWRLQNWAFSGHLEDYANKTLLATLRKVAG